MRKALLAAIVSLLWGCPDPQTGKIDPYLTAHAIVNQASMALPIAQGMFNQWLFSQTDTVKAKKAQQRFSRVSTAVANGLKLASDGVDMAKQAKEDPDVSKLLAQSDTAWKDLRKFLADLLSEGSHDVTVTHRPDDAGVDKKAIPARPDDKVIGTKASALTVKENPIDSLPESLIPG